MIEKIYYYREDFYDYFGGQKIRTCEFNSAAEALKSYRKAKSHEHWYDDGWYRVDEIYTKWVWRKDPHNYHGERCGYDEAQRRRERRAVKEKYGDIDFSFAEIEYLKDLASSALEDEEIMI